MAVFALCSELAVVLVFLVMTAEATGGQADVFLNRCLVAFGAADILVLALQLESGLVVIEIPILPVTGVMTGFALGAQGALVHIFLFMA